MFSAYYFATLLFSSYTSWRDEITDNDDECKTIIMMNANQMKKIIT